MNDRCMRGHEMTEENTYTYPNGYRACRECRRVRRENNIDEAREKHAEVQRRHYERNREAILARRRERRAAAKKAATE